MNKSILRSYDLAIKLFFKELYLHCNFGIKVFLLDKSADGSFPNQPFDWPPWSSNQEEVS